MYDLQACKTDKRSRNRIPPMRNYDDPEISLFSTSSSSSCRYENDDCDCMKKVLFVSLTRSGREENSGLITISSNDDAYVIAIILVGHRLTGEVLGFILYEF